MSESLFWVRRGVLGERNATFYIIEDLAKDYFWSKATFLEYDFARGTFSPLVFGLAFDFTIILALICIVHV